MVSPNALDKESSILASLVGLNKLKVIQRCLGAMDMSSHLAAKRIRMTGSEDDTSIDANSLALIFL